MNYHCLFLPAFGEGPLSDRRSASFRNRKREPRFSLEENALPESTTPSTTLNLTEPKVSSLGLVGDLMLVDGKSLEQPSPAPVSKEGNENGKSKEGEKEKEKETEQKTIGKELTNISNNNNSNSNNGERRESDEKWERFINPNILDDLDSTEAIDSAFPQGDSKGAEERPDSQSGQQRTDSQPQLQRSDSQQQLQRTDSQQHLQRSDSQQSLSNFYAPPQSPVLYQMQQQPTQQAAKQMPPQFSRQPQQSPQYSQQSEQQQPQQPQSQQQYLPPHQQKGSQMPLQGRPQEFYRQTHGLEDALQQRLAMESKQQQGGYYGMGGRQPPSQLTRMGSLSQLQGQPPSPMQSSLQQGRFDFTGGGGGMPPSSPLSVASPLTVSSSQGPSPPGSQEGLVTSSQPSAGMGGAGGGYYAPRFSPISGQPPSPQQPQQMLPQQQAYKPSARPITSPAYPPRGSYPIAPKLPPDMEPLRKYGSGSTASPPGSMYPTVHNISATQPPPQQQQQQQPRATHMTPNNPSASSMLPPQRPIQARPPYPQQSGPSHFSGIPPSRSNMSSQAEIITLDDLDMPEQTTSPISATPSPLPQQLHDGSQQPLPMSPSSSSMHQIEQQWKMASQRRTGAPPPPSPVSSALPSRGGVLPQSSYQSGMPLVNGKAMMPRQSSFPPSAPSPQSFTGTSATGLPHPPPPAYPSYSSSPPSVSSYPQPYSKTLSGMEESQLDYLHGDSSAVDLHPQGGPYGSYPQQPQQQPLTPYSLQQQQQQQQSHQSFVQHKNLHIHQNFNVNLELPRRKRKANPNDTTNATTTPATKVSPFFNLPPKKPSTQPPSQLPPGQQPPPGYPPYSAQQHYPQQQPHSNGSFGV